MGPSHLLSFFNLVNEISPEDDGPWLCTKYNKIIKLRTYMKSIYSLDLICRYYLINDEYYDIQISEEAIYSDKILAASFITDHLISLKKMSKLSNKLYGN